MTATTDHAEQWRFPVLAIVATTVAAAVAADLVAGARPLHASAVGAFALLVGVLHLRPGRRRGPLRGAAAAAVVLQPVLHATTALVPVLSDTEGVGHALATDATSSVLQLTVAAALVVVVVTADGAVRLTGTRLRAWWRCLCGVIAPAAPEPGLGVAHPDTTHVVVVDRAWFRAAPRRGPPETVASS